MKNTASTLTGLYAQALRLYPQPFQDEYGDELLSVFKMRVAEKKAAGKGKLVWMSLRELRDLPLSVLAVYLHERNRYKMQNQLNRWFSHEPGDWREILLSVIPFVFIALLPGLLSLIPAINNLSVTFGIILIAIMFLFLASLGILGLLVKLPRWSLPYAGIAITVGIFGVDFLLAATPMTEMSFFSNELIRTAVIMLFYLSELAVLMAIGLWLAGQVNLTAPFIEQTQKDNTLLSFMQYGSAFILVMTNFEDLIGSGWYQIAAGVVMTLGAWGYLAADKTGLKIGALIGGFTAGLAVALAANLNYATYNFAVITEIAGYPIQSIVADVVSMWLASLILVLVPLLYRPKQSQNTPAVPVEG